MTRTSRGTARAVVVRGDLAGPDLLADAVARAGLWDLLAAAARRRRPGRVGVLLAVGMSAYAGSVGAVEPKLAERMVDEFAERGFTAVTVGVARMGPDRWLDLGGALAAARQLGYTGRTASGTPYDLVDLAADPVPGSFPAGSGLAGAQVARPWAEAAFRVNLAATATHPAWGYALGLANLLGAMPGTDRLYDYTVRRDPGEAVSAVLAAYPPQFTVLDAAVSGHGVAGVTAAETRTVVAATDAVLADVVGATLMGLDPAVSPLGAAAMQSPGLPEDCEVDGDLTPYAGWRNAPVALRQTLRAAPRETQRLLAAALVPVDRRRTRFTDGTLDALNRTLSGLAQAADANPAALAALLGACGWASAVATSAQAWRTMVAKHRLRRRDTSLGLDLGAYSGADYDAVADYIEPLETLVDALPADAWNMRRTGLDGSVLFSCRRTLAAPYQEFVARVDIARAVRLMNDYLGGASVAVARDDAGRVVRQAERNLYLPQPNYLVLFGGEPIDVCKLEVVRYAETEQKICWRTVHSPNGSATFDDGSVSFRSRDGGARTEVSVHARQQFTLPLFWQVVDLDQVPEVRDALVADAYRHFFLDTLDNVEACYEGREFRVGRPYDRAGEELPTADIERVRELARHAGRMALARWRGARRQAEPDEVDADGFRHFSAAAAEDPAARARLWLDGMRAALTPVAQEVARDLRATVSYDLARWRDSWAGR